MKTYTFNLSGFAIVKAKSKNDAIDKLMDKKVIDIDVDYELEGVEE